MDHSNPQVSMDAKRVTKYPLPTGMPLPNFHRSTKTPFLGSIYLHTLSTLIVVFIQHFMIKPMQMHYAPLPIAATIVFIPGDKRLSGKDTIVTPIFLGSQKGPDGGYPSGENCEALLDSAKEFAQGH